MSSLRGPDGLGLPRKAQGPLVLGGLRGRKAVQTAILQVNATTARTTYRKEGWSSGDTNVNLTVSRLFSLFAP